MLYAYIVISAALTVFLNNFFNIFRQPYSWWLCIVMLIGFTLAFVLLHIGLLALWILCIDIKKDPDKGSSAFRNLVNATLPMLFTLARVKVHVTGEDRVPENTKVLLVCNHTHNIDPAVIIRCLPRLDLGFVAKKEVYTELPFVAKAMHKLHCLPIDRENNREGAKTIINAAKLIKEDKASVGIFPEGYTSRDGELQPMRNGAFKIAVRSGAPVVVCTLVGMRGIHKRIFRKRTDVYFDIVDVISADEVQSLHTDIIGERVFEDMEKSINSRKKSIAAFKES